MAEARGAGAAAAEEAAAAVGVAAALLAATAATALCWGRRHSASRGAMGRGGSEKLCARAPREREREREGELARGPKKVCEARALAVVHEEAATEAEPEDDPAEAEGLERRANVRNHLVCWGDVPFRTSGSAQGAQAAKLPGPTYVLDAASALNAQSIRDVACYSGRMLVASKAGDVYESSSRGTELQQVLAVERALSGVCIASVSCGPTFSMAVTSSPRGDVYSWGKGPCGELGHGPERCREPYPRRIVGVLHEVIAQTACGARHVLARTRSGALYSWGFGGSGQLGHRRASTLREDNPLILYTPSKVQSIPMRSVWSGEGGSTKGPFKSRCVVHLAARAEHSAILDSEGTVLCFGSSHRGQCGVEAADGPVWVPQIVRLSNVETRGPVNDRVVQVACGDSFTAARTESGAVFTWGSNAEGELGRDSGRLWDPQPGRITLPSSPYQGEAQARWLALGASHGAVVLRGQSGKVACWGRRPGMWTSEQASGNADLTDRECVDVFASRNGRIAPAGGLRMIACGDTYCVYMENLRNDVSLADADALSEEELGSQQPKLLPGVLAETLAFEQAETLRRGRWKEKVLKDWRRQREKARTRVMWMAGIPTPLRAVAWPLAVGNTMRITEPLYFAFKASAKQQVVVPSAAAQKPNAYSPDATETELDSDSLKRLDVPRETCELIDADLPRTFPSLRMFAQDAPLGKRLRSVLKAFAHYRPDIGYVQGMSYLAAILCLNTANEYQAFQTLANLLLKEHLFAFYRLDQTLIFEYYEIFERALEAHAETTGVAAHLSEIGAHPHLYLYNWLQTLFFKVLPLDLACRAMDCFLWEGTAFCMRASVAIVYLFREVLLDAPFETCIRLLSCSPGQEALWDSLIVKRAGHLFTIADDVRLSKDILASLHELNARVFYPTC